MKILDLCEFYSTRGGGVRSYLTRMARAASEAGHELVVVAPGPVDAEEEGEHGGRLIQYRGPRMPYDPTYHAPLRVDRMVQLVRREKPDVLQVSSPFLPSVVAQRLRGEAGVLSYVHHSDPIGCYLAPLARRHLPKALRDAALAPAWAWLRHVTRQMDVTITAGTWLTAQLRRQGCRRVRTVPFGIAADQFGPALRDAALRAELLGKLADDPDAKLLLITGRLAVDKRPHLLVAAAQKLAREFPVALVVLGDGPERERLITQAEGLPEATFLPFLHDRSRYANMLASVDLLLHGSVCETFGFVIAETLASGTPVIVPNEGAAPHMVAPDCAAVYAADGGVDEITDAARRMLSTDRDAVSVMARATAQRHPTMEQHFAQLFTLYSELLREKASRAA